MEWVSRIAVHPKAWQSTALTNATAASDCHTEWSKKTQIPAEKSIGVARYGALGHVLALLPTMIFSAHFWATQSL